MKHSGKGMLMPIEKEALQKIVTETKEVLATEIKIAEVEKKFRTLDLWQLQKNKRTMLQMRRHLDLN
jgi:hypothetical protein